MAFAKWALALTCFVPQAFALRALKPQDVVDSVLSKSLNAERISLDAQQEFVLMERALGNYDFSLKGNAGYEYREAETLSGLANPIDKTLTAGLSLLKKTSLGAEFEAGYLHQAQSSVLNALTATTRDPNLTLDSAYVQWRQHLWANAFGLSDRAELNVARKRFQTLDLTKQESTEDLVLQSLRLYWDSYVAQTKL